MISVMLVPYVGWGEVFTVCWWVWCGACAVYTGIVSEVQVLYTVHSVSGVSGVELVELVLSMLI